MSFSEIRTEHMRLAILHLLAREPGYDMNEASLPDLLAEVSHRPGRDRLRTELAWLAEQGLVTVTTVANSWQVIKLTTRGADVAAGNVTAPGVRRPGPEGL